MKWFTASDLQAVYIVIACALAALVAYCIEHNGKKGSRFQDRVTSSRMLTVVRRNSGKLSTYEHFGVVARYRGVSFTNIEQPEQATTRYLRSRRDIPDLESWPMSAQKGGASGVLGFSVKAQSLIHGARLEAVDYRLRNRREGNRKREDFDYIAMRRFIIALVCCFLCYWSIYNNRDRGITIPILGIGIYAGSMLLLILTPYRWTWGWWL